MHKSTKFYKWRQRFLRRNTIILEGYDHDKRRNPLIQEAWFEYNGWIVQESFLFSIQVLGKEFRE